MLKKILIVFVILILLFSTNIFIVFAATKTELEEEKNEINEKIKQTETNIDEVQAEMSEILTEIQKLTSEITEYQKEIDDLNVDIEDFAVKISEQEEKLKEAEEQYNHQQKMLEARLVALYESGDVTYLDVLLTSDGIADFISKYYIVSELAEYDTDLLDQMEKNKTNISLAKQNLEESKTQLETLKSTKEASAKALKSTQSTREEYASQLSEEEATLQAELEQLEQDNVAIDAKIRAMSQSDIYTSCDPSECGYIYPVPGYTKITTGLYYSWGGYHGAVDFGQYGINGQPVVAVKDGTVVATAALTTSYGNYVIINHHDGTYTLYAHGQAGSICVSEGQEVVQGQKLMLVGSTGNSTGPHLHFEVRLSPGTYANRVYPAPYLP